ncbi:alpha/beta fold hydrolase [Halovulum sp. GXIMD14793]
MRILLLSLMLCLTACAGGPKVTPAKLAPAQITRGWIEGQRGARLHLTTWRAQGTERAVIIAAHGYGDTADLTFGRAAKFWARRGITTYGYDHRGFGRNPDRRKWPGPATLIADLKAVTASIRARHPGVPLTVVGHSMGGGTTLAAAGTGLQADRIVLAGPAILGDREVNPVYRFGGYLLGLIFADRRFTGDGVVTIVPTDNRAALQAAWDDPYVISDPAGRDLFGLIRLMDRAALAAPRVPMPSLTLIGTHDALFHPKAVRRVHALIPGEKNLIEYPNGWHWLFRDKQAETVWKDVASFALSPQRAKRK